MKFQAGRRYLVKFALEDYVTEVKCIEISPSGWVKLRAPGEDDVWYPLEAQESITIVEDLGIEKPDSQSPCSDCQDRIVHE